MPRQVTLTDIARKSKCSVSTVSLVLRGRPGIAAETRARVLTAARSLHYRPRGGPAGQTPARQVGQLRNVGVILKSEAGMNPSSNAFYSHVLAGIESACRRSHLNLLYATIPVDENNVPLEMPRLLSETHADGFLLLGAFVNETLLRLFGDTSRPVVLVDAYADGTQYDSVLSDNLNGAYQATSALIARGHRHIGLVGGHSQGYPSLRERREGYFQALRAHGLNDHYHACCALNDEAAMQAAMTLLRDHPKVTALLGVNDAVAIAGMRAALEGVLERFDPLVLEGRLSKGSMLQSLLPGSRKARMWEVFTEHYAQISNDASDDFHTLFGKAFLKAYEEHIDQLRGSGS